MATIRNLNLNLFQDESSSNVIIHASYQLTFDVFEVIDDHVYAELLTLYDETGENLTKNKIVVDYGNITASSHTIDRDVDIVIPKKLFSNKDIYEVFEQLNGKVSIQIKPNMQMYSLEAPQVEGFVLN